jgi:hypothetical protein
MAKSRDAVRLCYDDPHRDDKFLKFLLPPSEQDCKHAV